MPPRPHIPNTTFSEEQHRLFYEMYVNRGQIAGPGRLRDGFRGFLGLDIMTSDEKVTFLVRVGLKADEELERLRLLHPTLNVKELTTKAYKAVVDHWLESECPQDPRRKVMEANLIEQWFESEYQFKEGHKEGGTEGDGEEGKVTDQGEGEAKGEGDAGK